MRSGDVLVVGGSTRPGRRSPVISAWVAALGDRIHGQEHGVFRPVDLRELNLSFDGEPGIPAAGEPYAEPATRRWSERVTSARGVILVTPQYNWGYPAPLKNAIDRLYREWRDKPVLIVSYGGQGGGKCAAQLREVFGGVGARLTEATPGLRLSRARIEANDGDVEPDKDFADQRSEVETALRELIALAS